MKKGHILGIVLIAVAIGAILSTLYDSSTYADFNEAFQNEGKEYHVVGQLNKEKETIYNPGENADKFSFWMVDNEGKEKQVHLYKAKPQDFERSEQIVLIGKAQGDSFHAREILMKCPSKYNDENGNKFLSPEEMEEIDEKNKQSAQL